MRLIPLALAFAIGPFSLAAQSAAPASRTSSSTFSVPMIGSGCPVSMQLQQRLGNQVITVQNHGRVSKEPATQLMLIVTGLTSPGPSTSPGLGAAGTQSSGGATHTPSAMPRQSLRIASAMATAYGFGTRPRSELVSPGPNSRGSASSGPVRNLQLRFSSKDGSSVAELWLPNFGAIHSLDLNSITWSDGSNWRPASGESCTVTPSLFMLVGADSQSADESLR